MMFLLKEILNASYKRRQGYVCDEETVMSVGDASICVKKTFYELSLKKA